YNPEPAFLELMGFYERAQARDLIISVVIYQDKMILDGIYLEHHKDAIKRGVTINKIFIIPDETEGTEQCISKIRAFDEAGVRTFVVPRRTIGPDTRLIADFLLYKNIVAISAQGENGMLSSLKITAQQQDFDDYTHKFEELSKIAYTFLKATIPVVD
ncbi:MAG: hypothetical protein WB392_03495, partial [Methanotrichaceae archaeon]